MNKEEIALQLTLKALECGAIALCKPPTVLVDQPDKTSPYNMRLICAAYKTALEDLASE